MSKAANSSKDTTRPAMPQELGGSSPQRKSLSDQQVVLENLNKLSAKTGGVTERDVQLLEYLQELNVLSLDHIHRLLWAKGSEMTAYNRVYHLKRHYLLTAARVPAKQMVEWGLLRRRVYAIGQGGWIWLRGNVNPTIPTRHVVRDTVLHDLIVAELFVRLVEAFKKRNQVCKLTWAGERAAAFYGRENSRLCAADGLVFMEQQDHNPVVPPLFIELDRTRESHGRPSADWGRKCYGYDRFVASDWHMHPQLSDLAEFPAVAVITHGEQRMQNLCHAISEHRNGPVTYYFSVWKDLTDPGWDVLSAPVWMKLLPNRSVVGREVEDRVSLLALIDIATEGDDRGLMSSLEDEYDETNIDLGTDDVQETR